MAESLRFYVDFQSQNQEYLTNDFKLFNSGTHFQYYTTCHIGIWFQLVVSFNSVVVAYFFISSMIFMPTLKPV